MVWPRMGGLEAASTSFTDLRRLADWFESLGTPRTLASVSVERVVHRLGAVCVPLLGRELASSDHRHRDAARGALAHVATDGGVGRERVIAELRRIASSTVCDEGKVCALGLLAELGARSTARF